MAAVAPEVVEYVPRPHRTQVAAEGAPKPVKEVPATQFDM